MRRAFDPILVCAYMVVAALPAIAIYTRFDDEPINGVLLDKHRPTLALHPFLRERYQKQFTEWFESRIGFKGYSVRVDNSILYHVFDEAKFGARVVVGDNGVLFEQDDIDYFGKYGPYLPAQATVDTFADRVARIQSWFTAHHRGFVPVIIPSKTSIYREAIPAPWRRPIGTPPPTDEGVYGAMRRAFDARGIVYVDARAAMTHSTEPRDHLWGSDARHWSAYAACLAMQEAAHHFASLSGAAPVSYPCAYEMAGVPDDHVDHDLAQLANAWGVDRAATAAVVKVPDLYPPNPRPSILITGCSFSWTLLHDADRSGMFGKLDMNYYNQTFVSWPENGRAPVDPKTPYWQDVVLSADLVILDLTETYALGTDTYSLQFVDQLVTAIGVR